MGMKMQHTVNGDGLADILERVLDKGVVIAGDVGVSLVGIELLTIKLRLVVCSVDKARELGINWWQTDPFLSSEAQARSVEGGTDRADRQDTLMESVDRRLAALEQRLG